VEDLQKNWKTARDGADVATSTEPSSVRPRLEETPLPAPTKCWARSEPSALERAPRPEKRPGVFGSPAAACRFHLGDETQRHGWPGLHDPFRRVGTTVDRKLSWNARYNCVRCWRAPLPHFDDGRSPPPALLQQRVALCFIPKTGKA